MPKQTKTNRTSTANGNKRTRNWSFIVYPDSAPEDWIEILDSLNTPIFISPLHDKDVNPDGEIKKPHYHVIVSFEGVKTQKQVQEITDSLNAPAPQRVANLKGYVRYLTHMDNPEKYQYAPSDVKCLSGADYYQQVDSETNTDTALAEMMSWCVDNRCYSFFTLSNYAMEHRPDWFRVLTSRRTVFLTAWLKSYEYEIKNNRA